MIKKGNVLLQVSVPKEVVEAMNVYCNTIEEKLGIHITKGQLIVHLYNKFIDEELVKVKALTKENKKEEN